MEYKSSFVLYESVYVQYERLMRRGKTYEAQTFIDAVMRYGLYGEIPDDESEIWDYGFDGVVATITSAKERYTKKINIPQEELEELIAEGMSQKELASYYNCSIDTIQRRIKQFGINRKNTAKPHRTADLPQNNRTQLNDNDNDNDNENINQKETGKAKQSRVGF